MKLQPKVQDKRVDTAIELLLRQSGRILRLRKQLLREQVKYLSIYAVTRMLLKGGNYE